MTSDFQETWNALVRYQQLSQKVERLKATSWSKWQIDSEIEESLGSIEKELSNLKGWIQLNHPIHQAD